MATVNAVRLGDLFISDSFSFGGRAVVELVVADSSLQPESIVVGV